MTKTEKIIYVRGVSVIIAFIVLASLYFHMSDYIDRTSPNITKPMRAKYIGSNETITIYIPYFEDLIHNDTVSVYRTEHRGVYKWEYNPKHLKKDNESLIVVIK